MMEPFVQFSQEINKDDCRILCVIGYAGNKDDVIVNSIIRKFLKTEKKVLYFAEGWYLPTFAELYTIYQNKTVVDESLKADGSTFGTSWYWSCCQFPSVSNYARGLDFDYGYMGGDYKGNDFYYVCSVRTFN